MKKIVLLFIMAVFAFQVSAKLNPKEIIGQWKYEVDTGSEMLNGIIKFIEKEGELTGNVLTDNGYTIPISKIEMKENNVLYLELKTENDLIKITVTVEGEKFSGIGSSYNGEAPIKAEKVKE